jgi:hypothetical protein
VRNGAKKEPQAPGRINALKSSRKAAPARKHRPSCRRPLETAGVPLTGFELGNEIRLHNLALNPETDTVNGIFDYDSAA